MKEHNLFYEICYKSVTYYAYHLGIMESPKHFIHLYNLDTMEVDNTQHTLSYSTIDKMINNDKEVLRSYLK